MARRTAGLFQPSSSPASAAHILKAALEPVRFLIDAMSQILLLMMPAAGPDRTEAANGASQGAPSFGNTCGNAMCKGRRSNLHRRLYEPAANSTAAILSASSAPASRRAERPLPGARTGRPACAPNVHSRASRGVPNGIGLLGGVTCRVPGNWFSDSPAR